MLRSAIDKLMWAGKATVFMMGLALMLALIFGMASAAFGANGGNFILGKPQQHSNRHNQTNTASAARSLAAMPNTPATLTAG